MREQTKYCASCNHHSLEHRKHQCGACATCGLDGMVCETLALHGPNPCKCQNFEGAIIWYFNILGADLRREEHIPPTMRAVE
jgi:hypothetical protein